MMTRSVTYVTFFTMMLSCACAVAAAQPSPPPGMPETATGRIEGTLMERTPDGKTIPLAHHPVQLEVDFSGQRMLAVPKETDVEGRFLFRFIDSNPQFSYVVSTEDKGRLFRTEPIQRQASEEVKKVTLIAGDPVPSAAFLSQQQKVTWPLLVATSLIGLILLGTALHVLLRKDRLLREWQFLSSADIAELLPRDIVDQRRTEIQRALKRMYS